ncbi:hypothetical protein J2W30_006894 [Variovorax boronicumulans]|uniref:hypothetical protein n=1 Tax=Variovorax boronicumulans TaxID=436515 RepID=UPI00277F023C|nr:hypothetical protein [Variovorax boronicumulans]MDQ0039101.1 hypothetical protein [Variovorax boronicumulans]
MEWQFSRESQRNRWHRTASNRRFADSSARLRAGAFGTVPDKNGNEELAVADVVEQVDVDDDLEADEVPEEDEGVAEAEEEVLSAAPAWTEMGENEGQDPLGMQSLCIALYQTLVPGIGNVTLRVRYYGFYAWLCWRYAQDVHDTSSVEWQRYLRRAEALCALVSLHANLRESGISGANWARRLLRSDQDVLKFHTSTDEPGGQNQYLKQAYGAFGAAYGAQAEEVGLLKKKDARKHKLPLTSDLGNSLAKVYAQSVGSAGDRFLQIAAAGVVTRDELTVLARMRFGHIDDAERTEYESLFFGLTPAADPRDTKRRRLTLELVLRVTEKLGRPPKAIEVRWAAYSRGGIDGKPLELPGDDLEEHRFDWSVYHANDLLHMAYECLFKFTLQRLAKHPAGQRPETLTRQVIADLLADWEATTDTWQDLTSNTPVVADAWSKTEPLSEFRLAKDVLAAADAKVECTVASARAAILLLAVLDNRMAPVAQRCTATLGKAALHPFVRSLHSELRFLGDYAAAPLASMLQSLVLHRIIERHFWVAFQKMRFNRGYTFLLESQDGLLRTRKVDGPMLTNPRLDSSIDFLSDLRLLDDKGLTENGRLLVAQL